MIAKEGSLSKWTNVMKGWQHRWLVLDDNAGILSYYLSRDKMKKGLRRGCIPLKRAVVGIDNEDETNFTVTSQLKIYHFQANNIAERNEWVGSIEDTILRHAYGTRRKSLSFEHMFKPQSTIEDFNKKLHEADTYLQMVIGLTEELGKRMETLQENSNQAMCSMLTTYANTILDEAKHTIILLQISKNTMDPNNSGSTLLELDRHVANDEHTSQTKASYSASDDENFFDARDTMKSSSSSGQDEIQSSRAGEVCAAVSINVEDSIESSTTWQHPDESSPSKDDSLTESEDETETVAQDLVVAVSKPYLTKASKQKISVCDFEETEPSSINKPRPETFVTDGLIDYDNIYDNNVESEITIERSVVSHLISQVKIGMDLSKVVLPIFILEKRSLLEMYADFFAHPDAFVEIADQPDAKSRMIQLVKWYLTSFHAARKSDVAKKPYNPILGEVFKCAWEFDVETDDQSTQKPSNRCSVSFAAEQVSHHPPISAFYAECPDKRISCTSNIWTKSKFYGLSVGVINDGRAEVNLTELDEQYTVTFPTGYGRSILTKPWFELGGTVRIACEKTGYVANVEFLTKPFYGAKKHKIVGAILEPGTMKPFVTLEGEWCSKIYARWLNGETEVFADVNEMMVIKKTVRSVDDQDDFESRKVWKDVTAGLWLNDISRATNAKIEIESRQRLEAQARKENGERWEPRLFSPTQTGNWVYKKPLG